MIRASSVLLAATLALPAWAAPALVAVPDSCGTYLQGRERFGRNAADVYGVEIRAFISGFNVATSGKQTASMPEAGAVLAYMDKYCRDHPLDDTLAGMVALVNELGGTR